MTSKTISVDLDVYERLVSQKSYPSESFSQIIRRARWDSFTCTGSSILAFYKQRKNSSFLSEDQIANLEEFQKLNL